MIEAEIAGGSRASVRTLAKWGGVAVSVGMIAGAAFWGWRLTERQVEGIPIIRAAEGPMRIAPKEPGGDVADYKGLSVSRIAADAGAVAPAEQLRLAPRPLGLAAEDMPQPAVPAIAATDLAVAEALGLDAATLIRASAEVRPATPPQRTPRMPVAAGGGEEVQLGAFADEATAAQAWRGLVGRFPDLLEATERRIERVDREDRRFWRLRAGGFADLADARRICAALNAGDAECVPVVRH